MTDSSHTLAVQDLVSGYGEIRVLSGVSLSLRAGGLTALVGANGAGKTTLLRSIAGSLRPRSGRILLDGEDLSRLPAHLRARRGLTLVPEGRKLFASMTVLENLEMGAARFKARGKSVRENLERVYALFPRLLERASQRAGTLSGGEQQMVALARGLMSGPAVLMFDELSLGLSPTLTLDLAATLQKLKQVGQTMLLVEQNVHLALSISDYAYVLASGEIWMHGPSADIAGRDEVRRAFLGI
jgi:branched-chain amino acid transport system ATP-binding protein